MRRQHTAVFGLGRLGRACAEAIFACDDIELAGIVHHAECVSKALPDYWPRKQYLLIGATSNQWMWLCFACRRTS